jgi:hypothetical protein
VTSATPTSVSSTPSSTRRAGLTRRNPAQFHVDFGFADGTDEAVERAERLGAIRLPKLADTEIFADPAAHPFCL